MVDADASPGQFILTGSHQFELMSQVSQSLAGRTALLRLLPLTLAETQRLSDSKEQQNQQSQKSLQDPPGPQDLADFKPSAPLARTLLTGFYPRIHDQKLNPSQALADYFASYVQRDLRQLAAIHDLQQFERFVKLCAGRVGQLLNLSSLGNDAGVSHTTAKKWIDLLQSSHIVHLLPPWFINNGKRLVKSPKLYFCDVGLACWLLGLRHPEQVSRDPLWGGLFENFIIMEALKDRLNAGETPEMYFYKDLAGHEVDLLLPVGRRLEAIEIKAGATVNSDYFKSLSLFAKLHPQHLAGARVIFGGTESQAREHWPVYSWLELKEKPM
jgi:uncharacterized protein